MDLLKKLVRSALMTAKPADCSVQGFGMFRLRLDENTRIHVWSEVWRTPEVSDIHDHLQWHFTSHVLRGALHDHCYMVIQGPVTHIPHHIKAGVGGGMVTESPAGVHLHEYIVREYEEGDRYSHANTDIHRTEFSEGAITVVEQQRTPPLGASDATVFVPVGLAWVDAKPRPASALDIARVQALAAQWEV